MTGSMEVTVKDISQQEFVTALPQKVQEAESPQKDGHSQADQK